MFTAFEKDADGVGLDHTDFGQAICTLVTMTYPEKHTVASIALLFNAAPDAVRQAVAECPWLYAAWQVLETDPAKQFIETDGE